MDNQLEVEKWKIRKMIKSLNEMKGQGTSMITLIIPAGDQIAKSQSMLTTELGTASNIKSRVNRLSVLGAITSVQQKLKLYHRTPPNGLVIYAGTIITQTGKKKKVTLDFEPFKPINQSQYYCDNRFHTELLNQLLESDEKHGFIIVDGSSCLYGLLAGNHRQTLHKFEVDLPRKHNKGGQSAARFERIRDEALTNYIRKVCEKATEQFIDDNRSNIKSLILAGSADFKDKINKSDRLDPRLKNLVVSLVDISYGGKNGFNQAIELSAGVLGNFKLVQEKKLISRFMEHLNKETNLASFGLKEIMFALEAGAVSELIIWEDLEIIRLEFRNDQHEEIIDYYDPRLGQDKHQNQHQSLTLVDEVLLTEWMVEHYKDYGATLNFISDRSPQGNQFCHGFGGVGGILRYSLNMDHLMEDNLED